MVITLRQGLKCIIIHKLRNWSEFATAGLQYLLGYNATEAGTHRTEGASASFGECTDHVIIDIAKLEVRNSGTG